LAGRQVLAGASYQHSGARFDPADDTAGLGVYAAAARLLERYGNKVAIALIGPGGEMGLLAAGIQNLDKDRTPSRIAPEVGGSRDGLQRLKAIVFDTTGTRNHPSSTRGVQASPENLHQA